MAPKRSTRGKASSSTILRRATKEQLHRAPPIAYTNAQIRQRSENFSQRTLIPSKFICKATLKEFGIFDEVKTLFEKVGLFQMAFDILPTYPTLVVEFLSSYYLRTYQIDDQNPFYSKRFKLGGRERFLTSQDFDSIFRFTRGGSIQINSHWSTHNFWMSHCKPTSL